MANEDAVPKKFDLTKGKVIPVSDEVPEKFDLSKGSLKPLSAEDFHVDGEGNYQMAGPDGKYIPVSYSQVQSASQAGYTMHPKDRITYVKDSAADSNLKSQSPAPGVKVVGRNSAGQPMFAPDDSVEGNPVGRFLSNAGSAIGDTAKGLYHGITDEPKTPEEMGIVAGSSDPVRARAALIAYRLGIAPAIDQGEQAASEFKQAAPTSLHPTQEQLWHRQKALGHGLAAVIPGVGPWAAQVGEKVGTQVGTGDIAGGVGTLAGNAALYEAPHLIGKGAVMLAKAPRATLEAVTDTSPRTMRDMAEEIQKKNQDAKTVADKTNVDAQNAYDIKKKKAEHDTKGNEIGHKYDVHQKAQELAEKDREEATAAETHNARVWDKTSKKYSQDVKDVHDANAKTVDKYMEEKTRIEDENKAAEHSLDLRRDEEAKLEKETTDYFAKEDAVKAKVKGVADAKWQPVHQTLDAKTIDGGFIEQPLAKIIDISPEVRREISQLIPDPEDAEPTSAYARKRNEILTAMGHKDPQAAYEKMEDFHRAQIDKLVAQEGITPEPIDLDPKGGVEIPFDKVHRAQSVIGRNIRNGRYGYEGPLLGEMSQLQKILHDAESKIAADNGMASSLDEARKSTREYQEAFGRARNTPKNQPDLRKQQANPEQFKDENEQKRVDDASKHDPDIAKEYEKVKAHREALKKLKTEDQLRKSIQQVPSPPTIGDLRSGYNLKQFPVYEPPTIGDLRDGYKLKPRPSLPSASAAVQAVKEPERVSPGSEPPPVIPDTKPISPEDYKGRKVEHIKATAKSLRSMGLRRAMYATMTGLPFAIHAAFIQSAAEGVEAAISGMTAGVAVLVGSHMIAGLIERPDVAAWLSKVTTKDAAQWEKLPPEQKELFTQDMKALVDTAETKGITVSPAMRAFVAGTAASQKKDPLAEVKSKAKELQKSLHLGGLAPAPKDTPTPAPGPQSSLRPTHRFDETTGTIISLV